MTRSPKVPPSARIISLLPDWVRELKAAGRSANTIRLYTHTLRRFCAWLGDGEPEHCTVTVTGLTHEQLVTYFAEIRATLSENSVLTHHIAMSAFFAFCLEYDELPSGANPMRRIRRPQPALKPTPVLSDEEVRKLLATCERGKDFRSKRDYAILRLFLATGLRLGELAALKVDDVDLDQQIILVQRGKGGKGRVVAYGPQVARALGHYMHLRSRHKYKNKQDLWLSQMGSMAYHTIRDMVEQRAKDAGLQGVHAHLFRHTFAHNYLEAGGQENALLQLAGWSDSKMLHERYGASRARERAIKEHQRLGIGEHY